MIVGVLILLGKILALVVIFLIMVAAYHNSRARARIARFTKQGMKDYPTNGTFFFGMVTDYMKYG